MSGFFWVFSCTLNAMKYAGLLVLALLAVLLVLPLLGGPRVPFWVITGLFCVRLFLQWLDPRYSQVRRSLVFSSLLVLGLTVFLALNPPA